MIRSERTVNPRWVRIPVPGYSVALVAELPEALESLLVSTQGVIDHRLFPKDKTEWSFVLDYPLRRSATFQHVIDDNSFTVGRILRLAATDYKAMYAFPGDPYGIYGHDITDLGFEFIIVNVDEHHINFGVGS